MLYSPKCPRGCVVAKEAATAKPSSGWTNAAPVRVCGAPKLWLKREYQELRQADPDGQPQLWARLFHLSHAAWLWFAEPKWQRSFHGIGAGLRSYVPGFLNSWTTRLSWAGATEATRVWGGAAKKAQDALRLSELAWIVPSEAQQLPASRHWDATQYIYIYVYIHILIMSCHQKVFTQQWKLHFRVKNILNAKLMVALDLNSTQRWRISTFAKNHNLMLLPKAKSKCLLLNQFYRWISLLLQSPRLVWAETAAPASCLGFVVSLRSLEVRSWCHSGRDGWQGCGNFSLDFECLGRLVWIPITEVNAIYIYIHISLYISPSLSLYCAIQHFECCMAWGLPRKVHCI